MRIINLNMKLSIAIITLLFSTIASAQVVTIKIKGGEPQEVSIIATSNNTLFVTGSQVKFIDLESIAFTKETDADEKLLSNLKKAGVLVSFDGLIRNAPSPMLKPMTITEQLQSANLNFEKFTSQRNSGKTLQFLGVLALGVSSYLQIKYSNDAVKNTSPDFKPKTVSPYIPLAGLTVMSIGIAIDIDASKHLRKR